MYLQPGPSGIKSPRLKRPKKKLKTKNDDCVNIPEGGFSRHINDLPNEILIEIFTYLTIPERLKAQKVCCRWYQLMKSKLLWRYVRLLDVSASMFTKILKSLQISVLHFECHCKKYIILSMSFPKFLVDLRKHCPSLTTLILEKIAFVQQMSTEKFHTPELYEKLKKFNNEAQILWKNKSQQVINYDNITEDKLLKKYLPKLKTIKLSIINYSHP